MPLLEHAQPDLARQLARADEAVEVGLVSVDVLVVVDVVVVEAVEVEAVVVDVLVGLGVVYWPKSHWTNSG